MGAPIVNGTPTSGDEAVVALVARRTECETAAPDVVCSGLLVAPRLVITAAHCVARARPGSLEVFHGADVTGPGSFVVVSDLRTHPSYDSATGELDVALLFLAEPSPVAPYSLPTATVADLQAGASLRAVGFGVTSRAAQDEGLKREGTLALGAVREGSFDASPGPSLTCDFDSGGPVFATIGSGEQLVGITSRGDVACQQSAFQVRADVVLADFVVPAIDESNAAPIAGASDLPALGLGTIGAACDTDAGCTGSATCARFWPSGPDACRCFTSSLSMPPSDSDGCQVQRGASLGDAVLVVLVLVFIFARRHEVRG
jgi:hypothetical protein